MTPAELALELGRSQRRVRAVLRARYGVLPEGVGRWELTDEQVDLVRETLGREVSPAKEWSLEKGDIVARRQIHAAYGGQRQSGISTPKDRPDIFIFTNPAQGAQFGYDTFEGPQPDGSYAYTGEGQDGPQQFKKGNLALRDAGVTGKTIRLFTTRRTMATYVGAYTTGDPAYEIRKIRGLNGDDRDGIIFNLVPLDANQALLVAPDARAATVSVSEWNAPGYTDVVMTLPIQLEMAERVISRVEHELQAAFGEWLTAEGHPPGAMSLGVGGTHILPDLYIPGREWIVEAKKSSGRGYVRTAIGQVLDYVHIAKMAGQDASPVILLPGRPEPDLVELISQLGIILASRTDDGFELLPAASVN